MDEQLVRQVVTSVLTQANLCGKQKRLLPVEVSARHVHLCQQDVERLFGAGHLLTQRRALSQPGQFLADERVSIVTGKGELRSVAVLGPARSRMQVELSVTDAKTLGLDAPLRQSGDTLGSPDVCILAGNAVLQAEQAVIIAQSHIHMRSQDALDFGVTDGQIVRVRLQTDRPISLERVIVRVSEDFQLAMHIDFDEANACLFCPGETGELILP